MFRMQNGGRFIRRPTTKPTAKTPAEILSDTNSDTNTTHVRTIPDVTPTQPVPSVTPAEAKELLERGDVPPALVVRGSLNLSGRLWLRELPAWLRCVHLVVDNCPHLHTLPSDLHAERLSARRTPQLQELTGRFSIREAVHLGNSGIRRIQADLHAGRLSLNRCVQLEQITGMLSVGHLDVRHCSQLSHLEDTVNVAHSIELAESGLRGLPAHIKATLRWNNVPIDARIAFQPEKLSGREIMLMRNVQLRRVLLERIGLERFLMDVGGLILDRDRDAGGERRLIRVPLDDDEDLLAVLVKCPSTGGSYALRVPPHITSCREAIAWTAGLSSQEYVLTKET